MLDPGVVHVWQIGLADVPELVPTLVGALDSAERSRLAAYRGRAPRHRFLAARGATRMILGDYLATPPELLRIRTGRWGKPELVDDRLRFNVSHSGHAVLVAVTAEREVGVDVERGTAGRPVTALARRYFPPDEHRLVTAAHPADRTAVFLRLWTRKEACVKAAGDRLAYGLALPVAAAGRTVLVTDPSGRLPGPFLVRDLPAAPGYAAAVALVGTQPYRVIRRRWPAH